MNLKKSLPTITAALAMLLIAVPGVASAATVTEEGKTIEEAEIPLSGQVLVSALGTGMECDLHATVSVDVDTVHVTEFGLTTASCKGFGSIYAGCEVVSDAASVPWPVSVTEEYLEVQSAEVEMSLANCLTSETTIKLGNMRVYLVNYLKQTKPLYTGLEFGPEPRPIVTALGEFEGEVSSDMEFVGAPEGTYEIG